MPIFSPTYFDPTIFDTGSGGTILDSPAVAVGTGSGAAPPAAIRSSLAVALAGSVSAAPLAMGGGTARPLTFEGYSWYPYDFGTASTKTATGVPIGAADAARWVVVALVVNHNTSRSVSAVSIGGVAATLLFAAPALSADGVSFEFWKANVPTGTTADVAVTAPSGWFWDFGVATYRCLAEPSLFDSAHDDTYTSTTFSVDVDVPEGGAVIAAVRNDGAGVLSGWVGAGADATDDTNRVYSASADELTAETGRTVSFTTTVASSVPRFFGLGVVALSIPMAGGGGGILNSPAVAIGGSLSSAVPAMLRSASAVAIAAGLAAAPPAMIRSAAAQAVASGAAAAPQAMVRSSLAAAVGGASAQAAAAAILAAPAVAVGGSLAVAELTALSYLISVAVAIGSGSAAAPAAAILGSRGASVSQASARASAALVLGGNGIATGASALSAAAALIRSAPAMAMALAGVAAPPAMIRSGAAVAVSGAAVSAPAAMIRSGHGAASGIAIMAGLGVLVSAISPGRAAFPGDSRNGGVLGRSVNAGQVQRSRNGGGLVQSERGGRVLSGRNGGTLIEG